MRRRATHHAPRIRALRREQLARTHTMGGKKASRNMEQNWMTASTASQKRNLTSSSLSAMVFFFPPLLLLLLLLLLVSFFLFPLRNSMRSFPSS